jgi:5-methylcytosine-specific restriction endonuclease McrA
VSPEERKRKKAEYDLVRRLSDPERKKAEYRRYYEANRETVLARIRARNVAKADEVREYNRIWADRNREKVRVSQRDRRAKNPDTYDLPAKRWRAAKRGAVGDVTPEEWTAILVEFDYRCAYCNVGGVPMEMEHMTPLSRHGAHHKDNVVPACRSCNRRKGRLTALEFLNRSPHLPERKRN